MSFYNTNYSHPVSPTQASLISAWLLSLAHGPRAHLRTIVNKLTPVDKAAIAIVLEASGLMTGTGWAPGVTVPTHVIDTAAGILQRAYDKLPRPQWAQLAKARVLMEWKDAKTQPPGDLVQSFVTIILYGKMLYEDGYFKAPHSEMSGVIRRVFDQWKSDSADTNSSATTTPSSS